MSGLESPSHIAILVVVLLLVFGAKRLPEIGRSLGSGMREFKQSITGDRSEIGQQQPTIAPAAPQPQAPVQAPATQPAQAAAQPAPAADQPPAVPVEPQHQG